MKWKDRSTVTEAHPFNHCSWFTSSAHTEQSSCAAQPVVRSQNSDQQQHILCLTDTALYTQGTATQDSTNQAWRFSWKTEVQMAKMNMEMHYVAWQ